MADREYPDIEWGEDDEAPEAADQWLVQVDEKTEEQEREEHLDVDEPQHGDVEVAEAARDEQGPAAAPSAPRRPKHRRLEDDDDGGDGGDEDADDGQGPVLVLEN